jgi:hypothetical protein
VFNQAQMNRVKAIDGYRIESLDDSDDSSGGVRRLLADITELAELQTRLVATDAKCLAASSILPVVLVFTGLVIVLGALPVLLLSVANFLVQRFGWTPAVAQLAAAGSAILIAILLCAIAVRKVKTWGSPLSRSLAELEKNMETLREILSGKSSLGTHLAKMERRDRDS